jgi:hypothetical protein
MPEEKNIRPLLLVEGNSKDLDEIFDFVSKKVNMKDKEKRQYKNDGRSTFGSLVRLCQHYRLKVHIDFSVEEPVIKLWVKDAEISEDIEQIKTDVKVTDQKKLPWEA